MENITDLQNTVARVESPKGCPWGTAFIIHDSGLLVTCAHVLIDAKVKPGQHVYLRFVADGDTPRLAKVLEQGWEKNDKEDIAFLKVEGLPVRAVVAPLLEWQGLDQESSPIPILACGFPIAKDKEIVADGKIVSYREGLAGNSELILDAKNITKGMSGGPVWDSRPGMNGVLGMVQQVYKGPEVKDTSKATPTNEILHCTLSDWKISTQNAKAIQDYCVSVTRRFEYFDLRDVPWLSELRVSLDDIYVKQQVRNESHIRNAQTNGDSHKEQTERVETLSNTDQNSKESRRFSTLRVSVESALIDSRHLVILGKPGSGKTTLLHYLALQFAHLLGTSITTNQQDLLPIYLPLTHYASSVKELSLDKFIKNNMAEHIPNYILDFSLKNGKCILLLDGLDEVDNNLRRSVADKIDEFLNKPSFNSNYVVVTSRIAEYQSVKLRGRSVKLFTLLSLQLPEIYEFVRKWFNSVQPTNIQSEIKHRTDSFVKTINQSGLIHLLDNPLLLRMTLNLYVDDNNMSLSRTFPNRVSLYQRYIKQLLKDRDKSKGIESDLHDYETIYQALREIAWAIHTAPKPLSDRLLTSYLMKLNRTYPDPENILQFLQARTGLLEVYSSPNLLEPDKNLLKFGHLTVREYFVADYLAQNLHNSGWKKSTVLIRTHQGRKHIQISKLIDKKAWDPNWEQVFLFLIGILSNEYADEIALGLDSLKLSIIEQLLRLLIKNDDLFRHRLALAALCLGEINQQVRPLLQNIIDQITTETFVTWWNLRHRVRFLFPVVAGEQLTRALPALAIANGNIQWGGVDTPGTKLTPDDGSLIESGIGSAISNHARFPKYLMKRYFKKKNIFFPNNNLTSLQDCVEKLLYDETMHFYAIADVVNIIGPIIVTPSILSRIEELLKHPHLPMRRDTVEMVAGLGPVAATSDILDSLIQYHKDLKIFGISDNRESFDFYYKVVPEAIKSIGISAATPKVLSFLDSLLNDNSYSLNENTQNYQLSVAEAVYGIGSVLWPHRVVNELVSGYGMCQETQDQVAEMAWNNVNKWLSVDLNKLHNEVPDLPILVAKAGDFMLKSNEEDKKDNVASRDSYYVEPTPKNLSNLAYRMLYRNYHDPVWSIIEIGPPAATPEILQGLAYMLRSDQDYIRRDISKAVEQIGPNAATPEFLAALVKLMQINDSHIPIDSARVVGVLGNRAAIPEILHCFSSILSRKHPESDIVLEAMGRMMQDGCRFFFRKKVIVETILRSFIPVIVTYIGLYIHSNLVDALNWRQRIIASILFATFGVVIIKRYSVDATTSFWKLNQLESQSIDDLSKIL